MPVRPGYRVLVEDRAARRGRRRKVCAFVTNRDGEWRHAPDLGRIIRRQFDRGEGTPANPVDLAAAGMLHTALGGVVHIASGVDIPGPALAVILDALASGGHHAVNLSDLTRVVSELGPVIVRTAAMDDDDERRQHAEVALYTEILRRCTTI